MKLLAILTALLLSLAGCGSSEDTPVTCAEDGSFCSEKEVTATNCDGSQSGGPLPFTAIGLEDIRIGNARGSFTIRKAHPALCERVYWARFEPAGSSTSNFTVKIRAINPEQNVTAHGEQQSELGNPRITAWTEGIHAPKGYTVIACLEVPSQTSECLEIPSV
jgi:hypothetical protein